MVCVCKETQAVFLGESCLEPSGVRLFILSSVNSLHVICQYLYSLFLKRLLLGERHVELSRDPNSDFKQVGSDYVQKTISAGFDISIFKANEVLHHTL